MPNIEEFIYVCRKSLKQALLQELCTQNSKVLLQSMGNYIQYPGININGKESEKE